MKLRGRNKVSPDFSMSSMTDIVFLLLVFFMLTSSSAPNALDLLLPKAKGKTSNAKSISVSINKKLEFFINKTRVSEQYLEIEIKKALAGQEKPTVILRAEEGVPIEKAVKVMDISNKNNYKVILAVRPK